MSGISSDSSGSQNLSDTDLERLESKKETTKEWFKTPSQKYTGETLLGHIHGRGFYFVEREEKIFYDGLFYANKLEGYSQVFYNNGCNFQGLFKDNIRFGPGIYTYPNGQQDVGLWMGRSLVRLGSANDRTMVPRLATTPLGQLKLLKYRYLVPVCPKRVDEAYDTLKRLGANEKLLQNAHKLYNTEIGNKHNVFFDRKFFDQQFFQDQDCSIDLAIYEDEDLYEEYEKVIKPEVQEEVSTSSNSGDINVERFKQLKHQIKVMEHRLHSVKDRRIALEKNVDYCKSCCKYDEIDRKSSESIESARLVVNAVDEKDSDEDVITGKQRSVKIDEAVKIDTYSAYSGFSSYSGADDDYETEFSSDDEPTISNYEEDLKTGTSDVTAQIKDYLMDTCICDEIMDAQDLYQAEKQLEQLKKDEAFYECILKNLGGKLEFHAKKHAGPYNVKTKKISVKDVLAWNNEERCMRMLKHGFLHRNSEYMVNFNVSDLIAGNRHGFGEPGVQERQCLEFINACNDGNREIILKLVQENHIDVNVCDAKGNGGIFLAAVNRETETIKLLVNLGAKIDAVNDEGLLPLSMCLLVYLAEKHNIFDWEKSFLPDTMEQAIEQKDAYKWYQNMSLNVLAEHGRTAHSFIQEIKRKESEISFFEDDGVEYFFKINCPAPKSEDLRKSVAYNPRINISYTHRKSIEGSIRTLLHCGANPNAGETPLPPLFLALFTENANLVESVLDANADANAMIEEDMTALHVAVSLKCSQANADICSLLLEYDCDPRLKTTPNHWPEQKKYILGNNINPGEVEDFGKNPLHIICARRDFTSDKCSFFQQMAMVLTDSRIDCSEKYLGHTPLSLAVLVGNKCLVESLIHLDILDPHQLLDNGMGNVLTVYILKRYSDRLPPNAKEILALLVNLGVNPLRPVGEYENVVAFMDHEHVEEKSTAKKKKTLEPKNKKSKSQEYVGEALQDALRHTLRVLTRNTLIKYIQLYAVHTLYNFLDDGVTLHRCVVILSELLTPDIIITNLQYLFKYGKIHPDRFNKDICLRLIDTVNKHQVITRYKPEPEPAEDLKKDKKKQRDSQESSKNLKKTASTKKSKKGKSETKVRYPSVFINTSDYSHILDMTDFKKVDKAKVKFKLLYPGLDNTTKYKVCFHCLKKQNKQLVLCPRCQLVYFCSQECNEASLKLNTIHVCNLNVFQILVNKKQKQEENLSELYAKIEENCENRRKRKREEQIEHAKLQFLEERKSDTYGTKWVRWMREQRYQVKRTATNQTLLGSAGDLARLESEVFSLGRRETNDSIARRTFSGSEKHAPHLRESFAQEHISRVRLAVKEKAYPKKDSVKCDHKECKVKKEVEKSLCKCIKDSKETVKRIKIMEDVGSSVEPRLVVTKLRTIPTKYEAFIRLLSKYFPEADFSSLFLPYTCFSNGHLYYKFSNDKSDKRTYSMM